MKYLDKDNYEIDLTEDRWKHISYFHPEMGLEMNFITDTLKNPDVIQSGNKDEILSVKRFDKTPVTYDKYCVVVYKKTLKRNQALLSLLIFQEEFLRIEKYYGKSIRIRKNNFTGK